VKFEFLRRIAAISLLVALLLGQPVTAFAYVGPGAGLSIVGSLLALLAAIVIGVFGFIWYPVRRVLRKRKQRQAEIAAEATAAVDGAGDEDVRQSENDA
jgi:uncharacterized membrane protein YdjX (TVP38/TMEM64 family)